MALKKCKSLPVEKQATVNIFHSEYKYSDHTLAGPERGPERPVELRGEERRGEEGRGEEASV